jgi:hypothetical protein
MKARQKIRKDPEDLNNTVNLVYQTDIRTFHPITSELQNKPSLQEHIGHSPG